MDLKALPPRPFVTDGMPIPRPTFNDTLQANYGRVFGGMVAQNQFFMSSEPFDFDSIAAAQDYVTANGLVGVEARTILAFGIGSTGDLSQAIRMNERRDLYNRVLEDSGFLATMLTDPATHLSVAIPGFSLAANAAIRPLASRAVSLAGYVEGFGGGNIVSRMTAKEIAKLGMLDGLVTTGAMEGTEALTEISVGGQPFMEIVEAAVETSLAGLAGSVLGYGLGNLKPMRVKPRRDAMLTALRNQSALVNPPEGTDMSFTGKWFNESVAGRMMPSPLKTTINDAALPDWAKESMMQISGDGSMQLVSHMKGGISTPSVYMNSVRRAGDWYQALDVIDEAYRQVAPRGNATALDVPIGQHYEKLRSWIGLESFPAERFYERVSELYYTNVPYEQMTPFEAQAVQAVDNFFRKYEADLRAEGMMKDEDWFFAEYLNAAGTQGNLISVSNSIVQANRRWMDDMVETGRMSVDTRNEYLAMINSAESIDDLLAIGPKLDLTDKMQKALNDLEIAIGDQRIKMSQMLEHIEFLKGKLATSPRRYFPHMWDFDAIQRNRDTFKTILMDYFRANPEVSVMNEKGIFEVKTLSTNVVELEARAEATIENILGEGEEDIAEALMTQGRHLNSRRLDIPTELVKDFLVTDIKDVMISYSGRIAPRIEWHKAFKHPESGKMMTLHDWTQYATDRLLKEGVPVENVNRYIKNFTVSYDRVVGSMRKRTDALDTDAADMLRNFTSMAFLRASGISAVGDAATMFMDNELATVGKVFLGLFDDVSMKMGRREAKLAGEALEMTRGVLQSRYFDSLSSNPFKKSRMAKASNLFMQLNLLGPVTQAMKSLASITQGHTLIDASIKLANGTASDWEAQWLARFGIDKARAKRIASQPFEQSNSGLYLPNTDAWVDDVALKDFRTALASNIYNRVIHATPADKPIVMDGVAYIPNRFAEKLPFDLPSDPRVPGYKRVESGLMALPFTFMNYTFGALSKITAQHASGNVRNPLAHFAAAMGLGYMIVKYKTPDFAWNKLSAVDKTARAFDFSGLAAIYSDVTYRTIGAAADLGFRDSIPIQPKFMAEPDPLGAAISIGGAPADWSYGIAKAVGELFTGDFSGGAKDLIRLAPFINAWAFQGHLRDVGMSAAEMLPGN